MCAVPVRFVLCLRFHAARQSIAPDLAGGGVNINTTNHLIACIKNARNFWYVIYNYYNTHNSSRVGFQLIS